MIEKPHRSSLYVYQNEHYFFFSIFTVDLEKFSRSRLNPTLNTSDVLTVPLQCEAVKDIKYNIEVVLCHPSTSNLVI